MTPLGYIVIPLGLVALSSQKWLLRLLILSVPFSDSVIANIGSGSSASGIQLWMFAGVLWLLHQTVASLMRQRCSLKRSMGTPCFWLAAFLLAAGGSLFMPLYINGNLQIASPQLLDFTTAPLYFSSENVTAFIYLVFGASVAVSLAQVAKDEAIKEELDRLWLGAGAFVALWGILQFSCVVVHLPFPTGFFNNNHSASVAGPHSELDVLSMPRASSVAVEPSILAQCLLSMLPLSIPAMLGVGRIFSVRRDRLIFWLIVLALILTFSSVAYVGLVCFVILAYYAARRAGLIRAWPAIRRVLILTAVCLSVILPIYFASDEVRVIADSVLFSKASGYSGLERMKTITNAAHYFSKYPLLGVGWGSVTSHDLLFKLLANVGLIGTITFGIMWWVLIRRNLRRRMGQSRKEVLRNLCWGLSACMLVGSSMISEFPYVFGHFWIVLGMSLAVGANCDEPGLASPAEQLALSQ